MTIIEVTYKWKGNLSYGNKPNKIVLHNADASKCSVEDIHRWHLNNGWTGIGYHFLVRKDGTIYRGRPENTIGAHVSGQNTNTLGICAEGKYNSETMPDIQKNSIAKLIEYLRNKYGSMPIYGHKELGATDCPGKLFPLADFKKGIITTPINPNVDDWVARLQKELNKQGYGNLKVDNIAGVRTHRACPMIRIGAKGGLTKLIQEKLGINADGVFGEDTERAVKEFQTQHKLRSDGIVGYDTWAKLLGL